MADSSDHDQLLAAPTNNNNATANTNDSSDDDNDEGDDTSDFVHSSDELEGEGGAVTDLGSSSSS